jgi:hypothetical protein
MCCFSGQVEAVWDTRIFARRIEPDRQVIAYAMGMRASQAMAMVLPLPVPSGVADDAVRFIDLHGSGKDAFFSYLDACFPLPELAMGAMPQPLARHAAAPLVVHEVGDFVASFVPARADFARLDARFRMPDQFWAAVPAYDDWGFAVFQLAAPRANGARRDFHPMAFTFPTRERERLFFPTLHVHDGHVHTKAAFQHTLYVQGDAVPGWEQSATPPHPNHIRLLAPTLDERGLSRRRMNGTLPNEDTYATG